MKLLLVDDEAPIRQVLKVVLEKQGFEVALASNGKEAMAVLGLGGFSAVITDIKMPEIHGLELLKHVRSQQPTLPVILMTGFSEIVETKDAFNFGANAFLAKPFKSEDLLAALATCGLMPGTTLAKEIGADTDTFCRIGIDQFISGKQIDLNNILTPIVMSIELLKFEESDPNRIQTLENMSVCARRGAEMVAQVLGFARGVEGERNNIKPKQLLKDIERLVTDTFLKGVKIKTVLAPDVWSILGDQTQLYQVLVNVCVNARDAMPNGGTLTISAANVVFSKEDAALKETASPGSYVHIKVEDSGTGMSRQTLDRIFEPFFTTKELGKGTGLGLSTSLAIIKSHGGFFHVQSEVGSGTQINIYLPANENKASTKAASLAPELPRGSGERILIVDDEPAIREITCQTLQAFGYQVSMANGGAEALAIYALEKDNIALVLTDMMMPEMDGPTMIRELRKINPEVLIITASGLRSDSGIGVEKYFLAKPFDIKALLEMIRFALQAGH